MSTVTIALGQSIQAAINANPAGTVFKLAAGTYYNQQFEPLSNDQFIGDPNGGTILSGAKVLTQWTQSGGYWVCSGLPNQSVGQSVSGSSAMASSLNDLFINNVLYKPVSSLSQVTAGTWYFNPATNSAYISTNPTGQDVELSVTNSMTYNNGASGVVFQNLTTEKYATDAQTAPIQTGTNWTIDNVTSTENHGAGLYIGGPGTVVQGGHFDANGQVGIDGSNATNSKILDATVNGNNYAGYNVGWDAGGIKLASTNGLVISGDTVNDNNGQGIWADIDSSNWTVSNNTASNNTGNGIQYEISHGTTNIGNNTVTDNGGSGIYISNSDGVNVFNNTITVNPNNIFNSLGAAIGGGIDVINNSGRGDNPAGTPYVSTNDDVHNNVIIQANTSVENGIWTYQALPANPNDVFNSNTYYVPNSTGAFWHFGYTDYTWSSLQQSGAYETAGSAKVGLPPPPTTPATPAAPVTTGSGPDVLTLLVSENAYSNGDAISDAAGDAEFTVSINGVQQGGTFTDLASHTAGADQSFSFHGYFGASSHSVVVTFLNDAYGPSAPDANGSTDRNLYVDAVSYGGANTNQSAALLSDGSKTFTVSGGTAPPAPKPASPSGTIIKSAAANPITDAAGNAWSLVQSASNGLQIAVNGVVDPITANVVLLESVNGTMEQENSSGLWYSEAGPSGPWKNIPTAAQAASPSGTVITSITASPIIDAAGNAWSLVKSASNGLQIAVNGVVDPITASVVLLEALKGTVEQENSSGLWFTESGPSGPWKNIPAPASPNGTVITSVTAKPIIDAAGSAWSLVQSASNGLQIAVNGVTDTITSNVVLLENLDGVMKQENSSGLWFSESGPGGPWINVPAPTIGVTIAATGVTTTLSAAKTGNTTIAGATFVLTTPGAASVTLGSTAETIKFIGLSAVKLTGGTAAATISADGGANSFIGGTGALTISGGVSAAAYTYHVGDGLMTLSNFSLAKGDSLTVDKSLQASITEKSDGHGGLLVGFGAASHGFDLAGVTSLAATQIHFT